MFKEFGPSSYLTGDSLCLGFLLIVLLHTCLPQCTLWSPWWAAMLVGLPTARPSLCVLGPLVGTVAVLASLLQLFSAKLHFTPLLGLALALSDAVSCQSFPPQGGWEKGEAPLNAPTFGFTGPTWPIMSSHILCLLGVTAPPPLSPSLTSPWPVSHLELLGLVTKMLPHWKLLWRTRSLWAFHVLLEAALGRVWITVFSYLTQDSVKGNSLLVEYFQGKWAFPSVILQGFVFWFLYCFLLVSQTLQFWLKFAENNL